MKQIPKKDEGGAGSGGGTKPTERKDKYKSILIGVAIVFVVAVILSSL